MLELTKDDLIIWLCENEALTFDIIKEVKSHIDMNTPFQEEAATQTLESIQRKLCDEISKAKGLTLGSLSDIITEEELSGYIKEIEKHEV